MTDSSEQRLGAHVKNQWYDDWIQDMPDLTDKVAIVTGANSGTGFWAANALAGKNCTVVLACRSTSKALKAQKDIVTCFPEAKVDVMKLDNMDLASVRVFVKEFDLKYDRLDYLLNNAGIMAQPYVLSKDGNDIQFQTNHLAHFLLTKLLWSKLVKSPGQARVVNHSSWVHHICGPMFDRRWMQYPKYSWGWFGINVLIIRIIFPLMGYRPVNNWLRYFVSKLCNILMMQEIQRSIQNKNLNDKVIVTACHPGWADTGLHAGAADSFSDWERKNKENAQSAADGSLPLLQATVGKNVANGDFLAPSLANGMRGPPAKARVKGHGNNMVMASNLWEYSEELIGERFVIEYNIFLSDKEHIKKKLTTTR